MRFSELQFEPYEKEFGGRDNCLIAQGWNENNTKGIRVIDDYSRNSMNDQKIYYTEKLTRKDGHVFVESVGYQPEFSVDEIMYLHLYMLDISSVPN